MKVDVPHDLRAFLEAGRRLEYDADTCEGGTVQLHGPEALREVTFRAQTYGTPVARLDPNAHKAGSYVVPGVDLVADCDGDYEAEGLLVWFPLEQRYGVVDTDHDYVLLFDPGVRWADIVASPVEYLNAQWAFPELKRAPTSFLEPWHRYPWEG